KVLNKKNVDEVLIEAIGKNKDEIAKLKARYAPKPVPKDMVVVQKSLIPPPPAQPNEEIISLAPGQAREPISDSCPSRPLPSVRQEVLTETLTRRHMTTDQEFEDLLGRARSALSHKMPRASELEILKEGLHALIREHEKRKGLVSKPRNRKRERPA